MGLTSALLKRELKKRIELLLSLLSKNTLNNAEVIEVLNGIISSIEKLQEIKSNEFLFQILDGAKLLKGEILMNVYNKAIAIDRAKRMEQFFKLYCEY